MRLLITGATGLVGSRLLRRLVAAGHDCRALSRPGRELPDGVGRVDGDILEATTLDDAVDGVTHVLHLAAQFRTQDADAIHRTNVEGTANLVEAVRRRAPEARFTMASTGLVYPAGIARPACEEDPVAATAAYPASKISAEALLRASGLRWSILRLGFVYGDGDGHLEALPGLVSSWGWHPAQAMSMIHHRDIAEAVELALTGAFDERIVNVVDEAPTTVLELSQLVGLPLAPSSDPLTDPWYGRADGRLIRSLGFVPKVPTVYQAQRDGML